MSLNYDYDIHKVFPDELGQDPALADMMNSVGINLDSRANYVALFRDPATVEALKQADQATQDFLKASGFGLNVYDSGAPAGMYPPKDEKFHVDVLTRMTENMPKFALKKDDGSPFNIGQFMLHASKMRPATVPGEHTGQKATSPANALFPEGGLAYAGAVPDETPVVRSAKSNPLKKIVAGGVAAVGAGLVLYVVITMLDSATLVSAL